MAWLICVAAAVRSSPIQPVLSAQDRVSVALYCRGGLDIVAAWCLDRCLTGCCSFRCSSSTVRLQESGFPKRAFRVQLRDFSTNGHESCGLLEPASNELNDTLMVTPILRTIAFNKPYGVLPCFTDPEGRPTLADYIDLPGVYAAGRLDLDSEGLILLTSDGTLAHHITDPQHKLPKVYLAQVERIPDEEALEQLRKGVVLNGKKTRPAEVRLLADDPQLPDRPVPIRFRKNVSTAWVEISLREGLNRQVRRMTAAVGHPTLRLIRVSIGPVVLGDLQPGQWRDLTSSEIEEIYSAVPRR